MRSHTICETFLIFSIFHIRNTLGIQTATLEGETIVNPVDTKDLTLIGGKYYLIEPEEKIYWIAALHYCRRKGLNLATIENENEMLALSAHLVSKGYNKDDWFWTSGNDLETEGKFKWLTTGSDIKYSKWSENQPDNWQGKENCVELWRIDDQFFMNDRDCAQLSRFICEAPMPKKVTYSVW